MRLFTEKTMRILTLLKHKDSVDYEVLRKAKLVNNKVSYYILVSHLRDLGLIEEVNSRVRKKDWKLTKRGREFAEVFEAVLKVYDKYYK